MPTRFSKNDAAITFIDKNAPGFKLLLDPKSLESSMFEEPEEITAIVKQAKLDKWLRSSVDLHRKFIGGVQHLERLGEIQLPQISHLCTLAL